MSRVDNYINMLKEFYYKKNGKEKSIEFLKLMIKYLEDTYEYEWSDTDWNEN